MSHVAESIERGGAAGGGPNGRHGARPDAGSPASLAALTFHRQSPGLLLPVCSLAPASLGYTCGNDKSLALARSLVHLGLGSTELWDKHAGNCPLFVRSALNQWLEELGANKLRQRVDLNLGIVEQFEEAEALPDDWNKLFILVETEDGCGGLRLGQALDRLEEREEGLGRAFYAVLMRVMNRWMHVYDLEAARYYAERWRESIEMDMESEETEYSDEAFVEYCNSHHIAILNVETAIPRCLQESSRGSLGTAACVKLLRKHLSGEYREWIEPVLKMLAVRHMARPSAKLAMDTWEDGPLPNWLVYFSDHDAVTQTFDDESQTMHEYSHSPTWIDSFDPADVRDVKRVLTHVQRFVQVNLHLVAFSHALERTEKHGSEDQHRLDDELRAA